MDVFKYEQTHNMMHTERVSLVSSDCLYKTQPERVLAQVSHTRIGALIPDEYQFHLLFHRISIILKQHIQSDSITNEPRKPQGDVLRTLIGHGYSKVDG